MHDPIMKAIVAARISLLTEGEVPTTRLFGLPLEENSDLRTAVAVSDGVLCFSREFVKSHTMKELKQALKRNL
ncbi:hypothetical protein [Rhizobium sp. BK068]|uniref:hypothetical protein n=1 Tax=Rhizobium sp. BK068 TaxID=2512130 RepID=UPI0010EA5164|nr:hypothetical protein [Rhizobium sp. BK068]TCM76741.1 hypothetical protein EV291_109160 [Rhizobium sp. BK068]